MRILFVLALAVPYALAQFCGPDEIPDKIAINQNGEVALGCRYNECPRPYNDPSVKADSAPKCGKRYYELSCGGPLQWVGGIPRGSNVKNVVPLQCCSAQKLRDSPSGETNKIVEPGQVFEGQVYYDKHGNVQGYDIIKNVQKVRVGEDRYALSVTVSRLSCVSKRAAQFEHAEVEAQGFGDVVQSEEAFHPADGTFQAGFGAAPAGGLGLGGGLGGNALGAGFGDAGGALGGADLLGAQGLGGAPPAGLGDFAGLGAGDAFGAGLPPAAALPPPAAPLGAPAAPLPAPAFPGLGAFGGGAGAGAGCFTGETMVETPSGPKRMDELVIGDKVLAVMNNKVIAFSPVESFLHRLPEQETEFHKISAGGSSVTLTPLHYIYTTPCSFVQPKMKFAKDVMPGKECLIRINGEKMNPVKIHSNEVVRATGVYNPMTPAGTVVADGFMASVHNVVDDNSFMNAFVDAAMKLQKLLSGESGSSKVELPWALQYAIDYASKLF